ncbi:hypothetical protein ACELLULO517_28165 [Acidisoma cellulosilytica]|uniref:Uncharacterized protein n=1 Tax=Acidisoma cellulosilyticum TaxID=2802395 RepID=A0A963Z760_9PROT|nr:hypothetical protein [Acidisoma cellulosilyticum]MCB8884119.1 hypothetical protein [Acidisoma cellulosilyticum]
MIFSVRGEEISSGRGDWEFLTVPTKGDRLALPSGAGVEVVEVLYLEHAPKPSNAISSFGPLTITVVVKTHHWVDIPGGKPNSN